MNLTEAKNSFSGKSPASLLIAGFAKCGTTSLARYLADHPDISTPPVKELYIHVDENPLEIYRDEILTALGPSVAEPAFDAKYFMDATPFYYCQQRAMHHAQSNPDAKVIFIVRHPLERLASSFRFFSEMYQEYPNINFEKYITFLTRPKESAAYRACIPKPFFQYLYDLELGMGNYVSHIERWERCIGSERVRVISMENLKADPVDVMSSVCDFLGIESSFYDSYQFVPYMKSYSVRIPSVQKILRNLGGSDLMRYDSLQKFQNPLHFSPSSVLRKFGEVFIRALQKNDKKTEMHKCQSTELISYYYQDSIILRNRFGIDYISGERL